MASGELSPLQLAILESLAGLEPPWTLTGGAALVGFHLKHRTTRDLDLFLHGRATLEDYAARVTDRLRDAGLEVRSLHTGTSMHRLQVVRGNEATVVDLIAEPVPVIEEPRVQSLGDLSIRVDTKHEILVNKLWALLQRSEVRDLVDVCELLSHGGELRRALIDAPKKDSGFSPMTLAWLLKDLPLEVVGRGEGWPEDRIDDLLRFRQSLIQKLGELSRPGES